MHTEIGSDRCLQERLKDPVIGKEGVFGQLRDDELSEAENAREKHQPNARPLRMFCRCHTLVSGVRRAKAALMPKAAEDACRRSSKASIRESQTYGRFATGRVQRPFDRDVFLPDLYVCLSEASYSNASATRIGKSEPDLYE